MPINGKSVTALLPMKAHSERVPSKNFRDIAGKPLFRWILDNILLSNYIDQVVINTDARTILEKNGINELIPKDKILIRDRPNNLCGDFVSMNLIIEDDINEVKSDIYLMTHTTNPLLNTSTIDGMLVSFCKSLKKSNFDSLFCVSEHKNRFYRPDGTPINHDPKNLIRTQDLDPYYEENSCGYIFTKNSFNKTKARIGNSPQLFKTPPLESIDIDEQDDWYLAESLLMRYTNNH